MPRLPKLEAYQRDNILRLCNLNALPSHHACPVTACYQLEIYGGEYEITDLEAGSLYFSRIFARNQMVGWGEASLTTPVSMIPKSAPEVSSGDPCLVPVD